MLRNASLNAGDGAEPKPRHLAGGDSEVR
jgi:hypothetical protein